MSESLHTKDRLRGESRSRGLVSRVLPLASVVILLVLGLMIVLDFVSTRYSSTRAVMSQMALVVQAKEDEVSRWIDTQRDVLDVVAGSRAAQRWVSLESGESVSAADQEDAGLAYWDLADLLSSVTRSHPGVREVAVLRTPDGQITASSDATRIGEVRGTEVYFVQGLKGTYASKAQTSPTTGRTVMVLAAPLMSDAGVVAGVAVMELDLDWVQQTMLGRAGFYSAWERYLVDRSFRLVVGPGTGQGQRPVLWPGAVNLIRSGGEPQGGGVGANTYRNYRDVQVVGAYHWIEALDLALVVESDLADVLAERAPLWWIRPLLSGVLLIGLLVRGLMLLHGEVIEPLEQLQAQALTAARGDFNAFLDASGAPSSGVAEVQDLRGAFGRMLQQIQGRYTALEARVEERTEDLRRRSLQLQAAVSVSSAVAAIRDAQELLNETVRLIPSYFDFDHVGIFLKDDRGEAVVLRAASSEGGQRMLAREHKLLLGQGIVGAVAREGEARIALDVGEDPVFFDNPDLPQTRSEMALPLIVHATGHLDHGATSEDAHSRQSRVVGVLDVQSERQSAFTDEDVVVFQSVADQVALAIENARLLEESDQILRELQMRYGDQVRMAWRHPLMRTGTAYRYTGSRVVSFTDSTEPGISSALGSDPEADVDGAWSLVSPIIVRGETLGSISLRQDSGDDPWDEESVALVAAVCGHVGEALENARLLDEAQVRAGYEQLTGNIAERIRASSVDVEEVLQTTLRELGRALSATGTISVRPIETATPGDGNGGKAR